MDRKGKMAPRGTMRGGRKWNAEERATRKTGDDAIIGLIILIIMWRKEGRGTDGGGDGGGRGGEAPGCAGCATIPR